jgi:hypothetical protein
MLAVNPDELEMNGQERGVLWARMEAPKRPAGRKHFSMINEINVSSERLGFVWDLPSMAQGAENRPNMAQMTREKGESVTKMDEEEKQKIVEDEVPQRRLAPLPPPPEEVANVHREVEERADESVKVKVPVVARPGKRNAPPNRANVARGRGRNAVRWGRGMNRGRAWH